VLTGTTAREKFVVKFFPCGKNRIILISKINVVFGGPQQCKSTARPPGQAPKGPGKLKFSLGNFKKINSFVCLSLSKNLWPE
jgi:hypothetical protein